MKRIVDLAAGLKRGKRVCTLSAFCVAAAITLSAQTPTTVVNFTGANGQGTGMEMTLVQGANGRLYGTTNGGGAYGYGTVFEISEAGRLSTLYNFCAQTGCPDGFSPAGLVQASNGEFYGTTTWGGTSGTCYGHTCGTVFRITPAGKLTTLYNFCSQPDCADGSAPNELVQAANGDFYGTTNQGANGYDGYGTVFRITPGGRLTTLYTFCSQANCTDGAGPMSKLVQAPNGDFYGTTWTGGTGDDCGITGVNCGTVFKITPGGSFTTVATVLGNPSAALVRGTDGNFYGTTAHAGTVFRVTPGGKLKTLATVGGYPYAGLVQATDGNFYGTTYVGGANNNSYCQGNGCGSIFEVTPAGTLTTLYNFCSQANCTDGAWPLSGLAQATNGTLYGTTIAGGADGDGIVFSLGVGLGPFVETLPASGAVGASVKILGTDLTNASGVSFNGVAAIFTVASSSEIETTVPVGASSGTVQVVTPSGTLSSNASFLVLP